MPGRPSFAATIGQVWEGSSAFMLLDIRRGPSRRSQFFAYVHLLIRIHHVIRADGTISRERNE